MNVGEELDEKVMFSNTWLPSTWMVPFGGATERPGIPPTLKS
jgi:hypothetical protein